MYRYVHILSSCKGMLACTKVYKWFLTKIIRSPFFAFQRPFSSLLLLIQKVRFFIFHFVGASVWDFSRYYHARASRVLFLSMTLHRATRRQCRRQQQRWRTRQRPSCQARKEPKLNQIERRDEIWVICKCRANSASSRKCQKRWGFTI